MITTPTVLVLGAGASYPYGFPTAEGLKEGICEAFASPTERATALLCSESKHTPQEFFHFREAFLRSAATIDAFLQRRPEFMEVGKLAIAYCLMPCEDESKLYYDVRDGNWYKYLAEKLDSAFEEFANNRLSIITFNYDRSLEHYLLNNLINLHGKEPNVCASALGQIPIVHVYGQLGETPYPQRGSQMYRPDQMEHPRYVETAAAGIRLYHEEAKAASAEACGLLSGAKRVCFLGFGYHQFNIDRLDIGGTFDLSATVIGTARHFTRMELTKASNRLAKALGGNIHLTDTDNLALLKQHMFLDD